MTADQIRALRKRLGLTQQALAYRIGSSVDSVRKWEQGVKTPGSHYASLLEALSASGAASEGTG